MKVQVEIVDDEGIRTSFQREGDSFSTAFRPSTIKSVVNFLEDQIPKPAAIGPFDIESEDLTIKERLSYFLRYRLGFQPFRPITVVDNIAKLYSYDSPEMSYSKQKQQ